MRRRGGLGEQKRDILSVGSLLKGSYWSGLPRLMPDIQSSGWVAQKRARDPTPAPPVPASQPVHFQKAELESEVSLIPGTLQWAWLLKH